MAIIIQKKENSVNIVNDALNVGEQIETTLPTNCVARRQLNGTTIEFLSIDKVILKVVPYLDIQYQDFGGSPSVWGGTFDELLDKLNNEYFDETVTAVLSGGATEAKQDTQIELAQLENWDKIAGNTLEMTYINGTLNPNEQLLETIVYKTGVTTILTRTFAYDANDNMISSTPS